MTRLHVLFVILPFLTPPYLVAVVMPSWRWLLGYTVIAGTFFGQFWVRYWIASQDPAAFHGLGGLDQMLSIAITWYPATVSFGAGVAIRVVTLVLPRFRVSGTVVLLANILGFLLPLGCFVVPLGQAAWNNREPSTACKSATFELDIAATRINLPAAPIFKVRLGRDWVMGAYEYGSRPGLREFCALTGNGQTRVRANGVLLNVEHPELSKFCAEAGSASARELCREMDPIMRNKVEDTDVPLHLQLSALDQVGRYMLSTFDDSEANPPRRAGEFFVPSGTRSADNKPLTFACHELFGRYTCRVSHPWEDGLHVTYSFWATKDEILAKGLRVEAKLAEFVGLLQGKGPI